MRKEIKDCRWGRPPKAPQALQARRCRRRGAGAKQAQKRRRMRRRTNASVAVEASAEPHLYSRTTQTLRRSSPLATVLLHMGRTHGRRPPIYKRQTAPTPVSGPTQILPRTSAPAASSAATAHLCCAQPYTKPPLRCPDTSRLFFPCASFFSLPITACQQTHRTPPKTISRSGRSKS